MRKLAAASSSLKYMLDYIKKNNTKQTTKPSKTSIPPSVSKNDSRQEESPVSNNTVESSVVTVGQILIERTGKDDPTYLVKQQAGVKEGPRPYFLFFLVHGIAFASPSRLKRFLATQDKWHKEVGQMRQLATLATHDADALELPLTVSVERAEDVKLHVLNHTESTRGDKYVTSLYKQAEADRKAKKQAKFSQLYRYLDLLSLHPGDHESMSDRRLTVVRDAQGRVISLPPLTNCHQTRLTPDTKNVLVEVSGQSLGICQQFAQLVLQWLLEHARSPPAEGDHAVVVRQIRVLDADCFANLLSVYPSSRDPLPDNARWSSP